MSPSRTSDDVSRKKVGPHCDEQLWEEFRAHCIEVHGGTNGVVSLELEKALRQFLHNGDRSEQVAVAEVLRETAQQVEAWQLGGSGDTGDGGTDNGESDGTNN